MSSHFRVVVPSSSMLRLGVVATLVCALSSVAEVYTWTDKDGVVHYTDDPNAVPPNVKAKVTAGSDVSTVSGLPEPVRPQPLRVEPAAKGQPNVVVVERDPGKPERDWRGAFRDVNERIARLEDEIEVDRHKVEDANGLPVSARFQCMNAFGWGPWVVPGGGAVAVGGSAVSVGVQGQGVPGFAVGGNVVVRQNTVVVPNTGFGVAPCVLVPNPEYERARERLELNRRALARAKTELADLDRRASFEGVPREWRR